MLTLIEHKEHGRMHVYSPLELEQHMARGWFPVGENKPAVEPVKPPDEAKPAKRKYTKKAK